MIRNLRYAARQLRKNLTFTFVAVLSLALGIGATAGMFSVADALLLRPIPIPHADQVLNLENSSATNLHQAMSRLDFQDIRARNHSFAALIAYADTSVAYKHQPDSPAALKSALMISGTFFQELGIEPVAGRFFQPEEDSVPGRNPVVILTYDFWRTEFHSNPSAIGRQMRINGIEFTIAGVAPASFTGMDQYLRPHLFVPLAMAAALGNDTLWNERDARVLRVKGRLKPNVTLARAKADLASIAASLNSAFPKTNRGLRIILNTEFDARRARSPDDITLVVLLMTLAFCVLVVACANVAGLLLSRARARTKEMAIRLAIGASRSQLVWQLLLESTLVSALGGLGGVLIAYAAVQYFSQIETPSDIPMSPDIHMDPRILLFTLAVSLLSTVFFGLVPAMRNTRVDLVPSLKAADADSKGKQSLWSRNGLVISQVAVSMLLLVVSAILFEGFTRVLGAGPGFRTNHLLMVSFNPALVRYTPAQSQLFYKRLMDQVETIPGVRHAGLSYVIPMANNQHDEFFVPEGYQLPPNQESIQVAGNIVGPGYFDAMNIPIISGRPFITSDSETSPRVAIVNQVLADHYFKGVSPVGRRIRTGSANGPWAEIVGVARSSKVFWVGEAPVEFLYLPFRQSPQSAMTLLVHSQADPSLLAAAIRKVVSGIDSNQPVFDLRTMEYFYSKRAVVTVNVVLNSVATLGVMGLFLAMVGLYGVIAFSVERRKREIGLRMAIGADRGQVLRMVFTQGVILAAIGIGFGLVLSLTAGPLLGSFINLRSAPINLLILSGVSVTMLLVTLLAVLAPARRACQIDPMRALRDE